MEAVYITGMICITIIILALISSKNKKDNWRSSHEKVKR